MAYIQETLWFTSDPVEPGSIVVVVAEITERNVTISEETSTSSQQVCCSRSKMMETLNVHSEEELLIELQKPFWECMWLWHCQTDHGGERHRVQLVGR